MPTTADTMRRERGPHVCYIADEQTASAELLGSFTRRGLAKGQRVLWLVDAQRVGPLARLANGYVRGGDGAVLAQVDIGIAEDVYLDEGAFNADAMLERYRAEVDASRESGLSGVRVVADTSWLAAQPSEFEAFVAYEHRVNELFADDSFAAICHYDPVRLPPSWLRAVTEAHPLQAHSGQGMTVSAGTCLITETSDGRPRLSGELDHSNMVALSSLLAEYAPATGDFHVDASALEFVDVSGVRALVATAQTLGDSRRLVLHDGPPSLRGLLDLTGLADNDTLVLASSA